MATKSTGWVGPLSLVAKVAFWVGLVILSVTTTRLLIAQARAEFALDYPTAPAALALASELAPTVAEYAKTRGDFWLNSSMPPRLDLAALEYRRAVELNPHEALHWNDLGQTCWRLGQTDEAKRAFAMAESLDPNNFVIQRDIGNFLLAHGSVDLAARHHARAIKLNPRLARSIYAVYWSLGRSPLSIAEDLLGNDRALLRKYFLECLSWTQPQEIERLWDEFRNQERVIDASCYRAYFEFLVANEMYHAAKDLWHEIAKHFYNKKWDEQRDALWNGDFDLPLAFDGGLEWQIPKRLPTGVRALVRSVRGSEPSTSLWIHFEGKENVAFSHVRHFFFVKPGETYRLSYRVDALEITTDSGPYVKLTALGDQPVRQAGKMVKGTGSWHLEEEFRVPPGCHWAQIAICRDPIRKLHSKIKGDVWYDDFVLEVKSPATSETVSP